MDVHQHSVMAGRPEYFKNICNLPNNRFPGYYDSIRYVSNEIGSFINRLTVLPGWENTLFVITSDHGEGLDDHPEVKDSAGHGNLIYETTLKVPLIFYQTGETFVRRWAGKRFPDRFPRVPANRQIDKTVRLMDMMPTILDFLNIPQPPQLQGVSVLNIFDNTASPSREYMISETYFHKSEKISVYSDQWQFIENRDQRSELFEHELIALSFTNDGDDSGKSLDNIKTRMQEQLETWEAHNPREAPISPETNPSEQEIDQLKALGYLK